MLEVVYFRNKEAQEDETKEKPRNVFDDIRDKIVDNHADLLQSDAKLDNKIKSLNVKFDSLIDKFCIEQTKNQGVAEQMEACQ